MVFPVPAGHGAAAMGLEKPLPSLSVHDVIDTGALNAGLAALAKTAPDTTILRKEGLGLIKAAFLEARAKIREAVETGGLHGLAAAQTLSELQDDIIRTIYDFGTQHI